MSDAKRSVLHELGPRWLIASELTTSIDGLASAFGRQAPCVVDLGGGTGEATRAWALDHPDHDVVAIEVHRSGIVRLVQDLESAGPPNVRVIEADGTVVLGAWGAGGLAGFRALFPDPWPKRRHLERRLVDVGFVNRATDLLLPGGSMHLATDWDDYADQMRAALVAEPRLQVQVDRAGATSGTAPLWRSARPLRPVTAYERRGHDAGRTITDLVAHRR
ncbi:MAG: tRNA (guanosine(46)-N7)-methyltransferase TrmB [Acidimicrobiia bacterium]|nr:tRNA (guanosine(46)-N7)-methyltransferase TrmB [Acidimicrobiia bacterium]